MRVYFDNAATTSLDPKVFEAMAPYMLEHFGNPSSVHSHGREVRAVIEKSRKKIAELLQTSPSEIFFTSGGTEADNTALVCTVKSQGIKHVISTEIEHHAVLHTLHMLRERENVQVSFLNLSREGTFDFGELEALLRKHPLSLVSLMQANNEIGNLNSLEEIGEICATYGAILHSDTVQTVGHYRHNLQELKAHYIVGSAHKFHGPKGIGFMYINGDMKIHPLIHGGAQERNMRGGTENVYGIVGMTKALEMAYDLMDEHRTYIQSLKSRMINRLCEKIPGVSFNGLSADTDKSLYTILNVSLPPADFNDMLLFKLDLEGISASGGSACSSGSDVGSHVLKALGTDPERGYVRFSFCKNNTVEEVDYAVDCLAKIYEGIYS